MTVDTEPNGKPKIYTDQQGDYAVCRGYLEEGVGDTLSLDDQGEWGRLVRCGGRIPVSWAGQINSDYQCERCTSTLTGPPAEMRVPCGHDGCDGILSGGKPGTIIAHSHRGAMHRCYAGHVTFRGPNL